MVLKRIKVLLKHKLLSVKPNGQYNFLTKKINETMDVDLAAKVLNTDYFKQVLQPIAISCNHWKSILVFAPHQDDEVIGCGALLNKLSIQGCQITLVFLTDGRPTGNDVDEYIKIREKESRLVAERLKADVVNIGINNVTLDTNENQLYNLIKLFDETYDAILTPWILDAPPKHRFCNFLLNKVFKKANLSLTQQIYTYQVHNALVPNVYLDYTENYQDKKELIEIYKSQIEVQNYTHLSECLDGWNSRFLDWSPKKRYVEVYHQIPFEAYDNLIKYYFKYPEQAFKGHDNCLKAFNKLRMNE